MYNHNILKTKKILKKKNLKNQIELFGLFWASATAEENKH